MDNMYMQVHNIGAVCFQNRIREKKISFEEILLDESLLRGELWVMRKAFSDVGGLNNRLNGKKNYELILRIAKQYDIVQADISNKQKYVMGEQEWIRLNEEVLEPFNQNSWETDCYLISRYKTELLDMQCFDDAVKGILAEGGMQAAEYLEQMLTGSEAYYRLYDATQPILIYMGDDICYCVLDMFAKCMGKALQELGCRVIYFDISNHLVEELVEYTGDRLKAVIGMQTYLFSVKKNDGTFLHDVIGAAEYYFVFDHPVWLRNHLRRAPAQMTVLTPDGNYAAFVKKFYGHKACFFPPAGQDDSYYGRESRIYEITFLGTYGDSLVKELKELRKNDRRKAYMVNRYILYMRQNIDDTPEHALMKLMEYYGIHCTREEFEERFYSLRWTMLKLAHYYRAKVVEELLKAGLTVHVFGDTWQKSPLRRYSGLICHEQAVGEQALKVYGNSKISLNIMTWHKDGFTERIANSMLQKSVVATDRTDYLDKNFIDGKELIIFRLDRLQELPQRIGCLLEDEERRKKIAERGYQKAREEHTWHKRAEELLVLMDK